MIVLLDSGSLGLATNPRVIAAAEEGSRWLDRLIASDHVVAIPEIVDYELRRELLRARKNKALSILDALESQLVFLPLSTPVMRQAAEFWVVARQRGMPTAADVALDIDEILAAQAVLVQQEWEQEAVIATTNVRHLARFATAREWRDVP